MTQFFRSIAVYLRPYALSVGVIFLAIAAQMGFKLVLPFAFQYTFDHAIPHKDEAYFFEIIGVLCAWWVIQAFLAILQDVRAARVGIAAINDLRLKMFRSFNQLPIDYFSRKSTGDLMTRFTVDLVSLETATVQSLYIFFFSAANVIASLILLFYIEWRLATMTLLGLALGSLIPRKFSGRANQKSYERKNQEGVLGTFVQETLTAFEVIHAFNLWDFMRGRFGNKLEAFEIKAIQSYRLSAIVRRMGGQVAALLQVLILAIGGYLVIQEGLTIGTLVGFLALLANLSAATSHLAGALPDLIQANGAMRRINEFLDAHGNEVLDSDGAPLPRLEKQLSFNKVNFHYTQGEPVLDQLDFVIQKGETVAIVGPSGSGKSTLLKLLLRFYEPNAGSFSWDGVDVRGYSKASLRSQIGVVPQDSVLFDVSIRENIRMGQLNATDAQILAAAESAELHDMIAQMPDGYDTCVGERGSQLSGGQRQRVAIARAILRNPALLILDEATSALDPATEMLINNTLRKLSKGRTLVAVTHRLNTVTHMDRILVMQQGKVVQQGRHEALLAAEGVYADLWHKQTGFTVSADGFRAECEPHRLKMVPLFSKLSVERLQDISELLISEFFPQNHYVFQKGHRGEKFYIIVNGQVEISTLGETDSGDAIILDSGDFFGELALLDQTARSASAKTLMPTLFLTLDASDFQKLMDENPELRTIVQDMAQQRRFPIQKDI